MQSNDLMPIMITLSTASDHAPYRYHLVALGDFTDTMRHKMDVIFPCTKKGPYALAIRSNRGKINMDQKKVA
ncbi:hypothetical protein B9T29_12060 [Acinetobacter sp. ANC 3903]|nr:hypothetical protein B9T29_12060 [Acinetobacter sp. ANC 3903]